MEQKIRNMNTTALAYLGDAVYEVYVRNYVMDTGQPNADKLHAMAVPFVRADGQALAIKTLIEDFLTEEEATLTKRARNHKISSKPRHASPMDYKWATAFEALVGALWLSDEKGRAEEVIKEAIRIIEMSSNHKTGAKK